MVSVRGPRAAAPVVVKLGGRALEGAQAVRELAEDLGSLPGPAVVVHGGGDAVTRWSRRLGREPRFVEGLRVTDPEDLEIAVAVLAGLVNKRLVAALRAAGADAVGLAALDGGAVEALPHPDADRLGEVGRVVSAPARVVRALLAAGYLPVLASIAAHGERLLNVNADDLAAALAAALAAPDLVLLSDTPGLRLGGAVIPVLAHGDIEPLLAHPDVGGGMRPKMRAAAAALRDGAGRVHITAWQGPFTLSRLLEGQAAGTTLYPADRHHPTGRLAGVPAIPDRA